MLSILIPTYNYNSVPLVQELEKQCIECDINFEILVYDDGSNSNLNTTNNSINKLKNCTFKPLLENIGRSAIRNLLAKNAKFDSLIFIDSGTFPKKKNFIQQYINLSNDVVNGGMTFTDSTPDKPYLLRWIYTKHRESKSLCSSNFLIKKTVFEKHPFDESIKTYGCEDTLLFNNLKKSNIDIIKIENPVIHFPDDDATTFIKKTEQAMFNLSTLYKAKKISTKEHKFLLFYSRIKKVKLLNLTIFMFKILKPLLLKNLLANKPKLWIFDFYRFGYICALNKKND
ncbi:glycosyltransferase family 2 protein [uncultured Formosa sp.]|uniref:glycosyltransferase family 2 protein n=1 Tax=uncultured Formosa sp. TaxID=255435 RepID=UPI0026080116|nr:glycosyltransferase family A protein [uncultured Formosa sp.]